MDFRLEIPEILLPLITVDIRYKILHGGRGGGKTENIGLALVAKSFEFTSTDKILCAREVQKSIDESVYTVFKDIIHRYELHPYFSVLKNKIVNKKSGCTIIFHGLRDLSVDSIKSIKGIRICWVEEAHSVTTNSWRILKPSIRVEGSEIWVSFNRKFRRDPVWREFCEVPDENTLIIYINWPDNPFFPDVLRAEKDRDYKNLSKEEADHIWLGLPQAKSNLRVFRFDPAVSTINKKIPYYDGVETWTAWDFGVADPTAIIFIQILQDPKAPNGVWINIFDEYINRNHSSGHYKKVVLGKEHFDANWKHAGDPAGAARSHSLNSWIDELGPEIDIDYTTGKSINEYVDLANKYLPSVRINEQATPQTYDMFTNWEYPAGEDGYPKEGSKPKHDVYSHPGTAFYYFVMERFNPDYQNRKFQII